jgi:hypothetical protein
MEEIMGNIELVIGVLSFILIVIGVIKIHISVKTKYSFMMVIAVVASIIILILYILAWTVYKFYYSPDKSPLAISVFLASIDHILTIVSLIGAIGFWGFSKIIKRGN